jgi:hypothetical protein
MLSPHELAALLILNSASVPYQLDPADLEALIDNKLVQQVQIHDREHLRLTGRGRQVLESITRAD